jgi:TolB-like protein/lipopolysaccharide biosynthesis regulator YciM
LRVGAAYLVVGWLILQFVDVVFPMFGLDEALGRPILIIMLIGLPVTLVLAWVFELTPEGIKKEKDVDRSKSVTAQTGRMLDRSIIVVLMLAIGLLLFDKFALLPELEIETQATQSPRLDSIAVLPFVNLGGDYDNEYFSDGLTETLLHMLAQLPELKVAARTSVFSFKGKEIDIRDIAEQLGVATVLEGSVQRSGNTVRITAQLIEAETGFHLWSQTFDRSLDDIFMVQDEIATNVAEKLQATLLGETPADLVVIAGSLGTKNPQAYEKYLLALEQKNIGSYGSLPIAEGLFKEALSIDPEFVEAKVELAITYSLDAETGLLTNDEAESKIRPLLDQVLHAKPKHSRALGLLASIDYQIASRTYGPGSDEAVQAATHLVHCLELNPNNPDLYSMLSNAANNSNHEGHEDEALAWLDEGLEHDPMSARLLLQRGRLLMGPLERPDEAEESFAKGREIAPEWTAVIFSSGFVAFTQERYADGVSWFQRAMAVDPQDHELPAMIARLYYQLGLADEGNEMLRRAQALAPQEPATRGLELLKQLHAENHERAAILAERMILDGVDNRNGAFNIAVTGYVGSMIELGKADAVAGFFETVQPGISNPLYSPLSVNEAFMQFVLVQALVKAGAYDTANAILASLEKFADTAFPRWRENEYIMASLSIAQGNREAAVEYALKDLDQPLGEQLNWSMNYQHRAWMKPLLKDERIALRISELEAETLAAGNEVRAMLAEQRATL